MLIVKTKRNGVMLFGLEVNREQIWFNDRTTSKVKAKKIVEKLKRVTGITGVSWG